MRRTTAVGAIVLLAACGRGILETPVTPAPPPGPQPSFVLSGEVLDTIFRSVDQARIEVVDGPEAGAVTTSDRAGRFSFGDQAFTQGLTLRASKDGYVLSQQSAIPLGSSKAVFVSFRLSSSTPSLVGAGDYAVTLTADAACAALPLNAMTRSYTATLSPGPYSNYVLRLGGATFAAPATSAQYDTFFTYVFGAAVRVFLYSADDVNGIVEQLGPDSYIGIDGEVAATVETLPVDVLFSGRFSYCPGPRAASDVFGCVATPITCESKSHRLRLARQ